MKTEMKDRIRSRRVQLDITQLTLAKNLGSVVSVTKWGERHEPSLMGKIFINLLWLSELSPEWILYGEGEVAKDDIKVMPFLNHQ